MAHYEVPGMFDSKTAIKIWEKMQGKSYMNFNLSCFSYAGNCSITVKTDYDCTDEELQNLFVYCALNELAELAELD